MATEKKLIDQTDLIETLSVVAKKLAKSDAQKSLMGRVIYIISHKPTVDAVEVPDKKLLRAIKLLIKQYEHSKNAEYVHSPVAHALFHTWRQVDERRPDA